jgi:ferredoxin-NADP reductase
MWPAGKDSLPGQHVDIRLTAEDGDQPQRSYSIASPPEDELIALTVVRRQRRGLSVSAW